MKARLAPILGAVVCAMTALFAAALFLPKQSLWIDETTQVGGIAAGPAKVVPFLTGRIDLPGVPFDRTPPLAYWVQQAWSKVCGGSIASLRWCGALCVAMAAAFVFLAARRAFGLASGYAAGLIFALSPNVSTLGVEIRAYPLFILLSAATIWALVCERTADPNRRNRWLFAVVPLATLAAYTQYFGVILTAAVGFSLLIARWRAKESVKPLMGAAAVTFLAFAGLYPFILFAVRHSDQSAAPAARAATRDILRLAYRLIGHPALAVSRPATAAAFSGALALAIAAALLKRRSSALLAVTLTLASGLLAVALAIFLVRGFDAGAPHYNSWALPALCVTLSAGLAASGKGKWIGAAGLALVLIAEVFSTAELARRGPYFAHGPYSRLAAVIERIGPEHVTLIVDGPDTHLAAGVYFPLHVLFGDRLKQLVVLPSDGPPRAREILAQQDKTGRLISSLPVAPTDFVIVIQTRDTSSDEITARLRSGVGESAPLMNQGPLAQWLSSQEGWRKGTQFNYLAFVSARVELYTKPRH